MRRPEVILFVTTEHADGMTASRRERDDAARSQIASLTTEAFDAKHPIGRMILERSLDLVGVVSAAPRKDGQ